MRILIVHHNFVRDYRGCVILRRALENRGHECKIVAAWRGDVKAAREFMPGCIIVPQIAEHSTHYIAAHAKSFGIPLIVNSSEHFVAPANIRAFLAYNNDQLNTGHITFQVVADTGVWNHIQTSAEIRDKCKYKRIGIPRFDLSVSPHLRDLETDSVRKRYGIPESGKRVLLYLSSLLFDATYEGVPESDMRAWGYRRLVENNKATLDLHKQMLAGLLKSASSRETILLVKPHPWDPSQTLCEAFRQFDPVILAHDEYITPCLNVADVVLHFASTSAVEAWLLRKPTICLPSARHEPLRALPHVIHDLQVSNAKELLDACENPSPRPLGAVTALMGRWPDGFATERLADHAARVRKSFALKPVVRRLRLAATNAWSRNRAAAPPSPPPTGRFALMAKWEERAPDLDLIYSEAYIRHVRTLSPAGIPPQ